MRIVTVAIAAALAANAAGCATEQSGKWYRADGRHIPGDAALLAQAERDTAICRGEMAKADSASPAPAPRRLQADDDVMIGCMASRGYVWKLD